MKRDGLPSRIFIAAIQKTTHWLDSRCIAGKMTMTNVGMALPCRFRIYAWYRYRNNKALGKDRIFFKNAGSVLLATSLSLILVAFGNDFTVVAPFISGDISTSVWTIIGPRLFVVIAMHFKIKLEDAH